ncbi:FAD-dependent oxidoreductase [Streptomyces sp. NPDC047971]|uniref:FAD-dependent oxidoreductase n=1 Tax=Streptomyces sp. NPDC047971 TaxID=3154499 RepID=UPI0034115069
MNDVLIVGNGPAAHRLAERLIRHGHDARLTLLGEEPEPAYHRALLPAYAAASLPRDALRLPPLPRARVHLNTVVTAVDRRRRRVHAYRNGSATVHRYDTLVLATGARPRIPDIPGLRGPGGSPAPGVTTLRTTADCDRIAGGSVAVLGGGPLAVEAADALAARGTGVTLVCPGPHPLHDRVGDVCGAMLAARLESAGVTVVGGAVAVRRTPDRLELADGTVLRADTLVLCTGVTPDTRLARAAGLDVRHGIVVDDRLRTSDPHVHALGDCAEFDGQTLTGVGGAHDQADTLARVLTGRPASHRRAPEVLRVRTRSADLSCLGSPADFDRPGTRQLTLTDHAGHRYAGVALRDERVTAAVLFGVPQAIATLGLMHRRGRPVPGDLLGLLLDLPPRAASDSAGADPDPMVCLCNGVTRQRLHRAWRDGARTLPALAEETRATTGCGGCGRTVEELCGQWSHESRDRVEETCPAHSS